jgi:hypothetical protein
MSVLQVWINNVFVCLFLEGLGQRLILLYKIINGLVAIPADQHIQPNPRPSRNRHTKTLLIHTCNTIQHKSSPLLTGQVICKLFGYGCWCSVEDFVEWSLKLMMLCWIFCNDLPSCVTSQVRLFADDCLLYRSIKSINDQIQLQQDLQSKALLKSSITRSVCNLRSNVFIMSCMVITSWLSHEWPDLKPCCKEVKMLYRSRCCRMC